MHLAQPSQEDDERLQELIENWIERCQEALQRVYGEMRKRRDGLTMLDVLNHLRISPDLVRYDPDAQEFS